jgi:DNA invertase Pin-like site-specific DNA recombinase
VFDTSRLARDVHLAGVFRQECRRRGVKIAFVKIPETDPLSDLIIGHVYQLLDHIHSHMSREKGLAGMAENVRRGFRAGGVAPYGYELEKVEQAPSATARR